VYEPTFRVFDFNAYDIAGVMVHEATHAWQQYAIVQLAEKNRAFRDANLFPSQPYYSQGWSVKYNAAMEVQASEYALNASPATICLSEKARRILTEYRDHFAGLSHPLIPGIDAERIELNQDTPLR